MYPFHCYSVACAGINPCTLEDVCRMPLHKFHANCTCVSRNTRRWYSSSRSLDVFPSFPCFAFLTSRHLRSSLISPCLSLLLFFTQPLTAPRHCRKVDMSYLLPHFSPFLFVHTSIRRSLRAATSNYSNASRVQRG